MNASNGALVASLACDDEELAAKLAVDVQAFKVGINRPRSRGDREEPFGGRGASWKGAFVGGDLLVQAVTVGDAERAPLRQLPRLLELPGHLTAAPLRSRPPPSTVSPMRTPALARNRRSVTSIRPGSAIPATRYSTGRAGQPGQPAARPGWS